MKYKLLALILTVTIVSWTQTATQSTSSALQENTAPDKAKCPCCDKMASSDAKDAHAACMRKHDGKEMASCCSGKDAKSCCNGKEAKHCMNDDKAAASCCKDCCGKEKDKTASCCRKSGKECGKGCCGTNKSEKPA
jgi:hypothetical protein